MRIQRFPLDLRFPPARLDYPLPMLLVIASLLCAPLSAQLTRGSISGVLKDPSGAILASAGVQLTNLATDEKVETRTNETGVYHFVAVEPGFYRIEFSWPGLSTQVLEPVRVGPGLELVLNQILELSVGNIAVQVKEPAIVFGLARAGPTIERTLEGEFLELVPFTSQTRDVGGIALLAPGIARGPGSSGISSNGQRTRQNNFTIGGVDNNDITVTGASARLIPEAVSEVQIQVSPFSAEYGRNTGAQILPQIRSGTNLLHGSMWDYFTANWLEAVSLPNKRFQLQQAVGSREPIFQTPRYVQNQAGGRIGGPIRKEKSFFWALLEANRRREQADARNAIPAIVPTPAGYRALSEDPLGTGQTMQSRQAALDALSFLPEIYETVHSYDAVSTQLVNGVPIEFGRILLPIARPYDFWLGVLRLDHRLNDNNSATYRYLFDKRFQPDVAGNTQFGSRYTAGSDFLSQNHALSLTSTWVVHLINEFRFGYARTNQAFKENDPTSPTVIVSGTFNFGGASNFPQGRVSNIFQWQDVMTYLFGRHSVKLGADIRRNFLSDKAAFDSKGTWLFASFSDYLNNRASLLRQVVSDASFDARQSNQNYFVQDEFKATGALTITVGLRYEYSGVPFGFFGAASEDIATAGVPTPARPDKNNWGPRFGFAYSPMALRGWKGKILGNQRTVFRGGFGITYDVLFLNLITTTASNYPRVVRFDIGQPQTINLFPTLFQKQAEIPPFNPLTTFVNVPTNIQNPTTHFWNISIQRQFGRNYLFELGYSGNRSYHLIRLTDKNPAVLTLEQAQAVINAGTTVRVLPSVQSRRVNPAWGSRLSLESTALSKYHGLHVRFDRNFAGGFLLGSNYTWSGTFSDNDEALGVGDIVLSSPRVPQDPFNFRSEWSRSVFDRPHRVSIYYLFQTPWHDSWRREGPFLRHILGGWQIGGSFEWQSGQPFTVRTGVDSGGSGLLPAEGSWRPDLNQNGILRKDPITGDLRTFSSPIDGTGVFVTPLGLDGLPLSASMPNGGNLGRNTFRGPSFSVWNLSIVKKIALSEGITLELGGSCLNLWNHRNFGNPVAIMNRPDFGTNTSDPGNRNMLLSAKILF